MEKKEELLERLVNEIAAQNKLIALLIAKENCKMYVNTDFVKEDEYLSLLIKRMNKILESI